MRKFLHMPLTRLQLHFFWDQRLPKRQLIGYNKNYKLECSWIGGPGVVRRLRHLLRLHKPQLFFLMETKIDNNKMEHIRRKLGYLNGIDVGVDGSKGRLCLAWKDSLQV